MSQTGSGRVGFFEDFIAATDDDILAVADADGLRYNDIFIVAQSGQADIVGVTGVPNGVMRFNGAGAAADGFALLSAPMKPSTQGTVSVEVRMKASAVTAWRWFFGLASTVDRDESVSPFSLSGTTLTANNAGQAVGFYFDTAATTDDVRWMASNAGTAFTGAKGLNNVLLGSLGTRMNTTLVADKWIYMRVELDADGAARGYYGDVTTDPGNTGPQLKAAIAGGNLDATAAYVPYFHCVDTSTGDANYDVDFFGGSAGRDWAY
jgi:hypothetical protein